MKRYIITEELKYALKNSDTSLRQISKKLGFEVKNIIHSNRTINKEHIVKLSSFFNTPFSLPEIYLNYAKNLGKYAHNSYETKKLQRGEDLAEFCGVMLGDGNLHERGIKIAFDKRCVKYIEYVAKLFYSLASVEMKHYEVKTTNQGYLYFYSTKLADELTDFGLVKGDKIKNNVGIPNWIKEKEEYTKRCIRGLIDTDGCIYICKRERQRYVKFTNFNRRLLEEFRDLALKLGYHFASANRKNVCLYRKDEVIRFINDIKPVRAGDVV